MPSIDFTQESSNRQSIMVSRSFSKELYDITQLHDTITTFAGIAAEKLRKQNCVAQELQVFIITNYATVTGSQANATATEPTVADSEVGHG